MKQQLKNWITIRQKIRTGIGKTMSDSQEIDGLYQHRHQIINTGMKCKNGISSRFRQIEGYQSML